MINLKDNNNVSKIEEIKSELLKGNIKITDQNYFIITKKMRNNLATIKSDTIFICFDKWWK